MVPIDLVAALVSDELLRRQDRLLARRHKQARFRDPDLSLDSFDFAFNRKIKSGGRRPPVHVTPQQHNSCSYPAPENRVPLGDFATCHGAVVSAKARGYTTANGCYWCANDCAGVSARHGSADRSATRVGP